MPLDPLAGSTLGARIMRHFHISHNAPYLPPKFDISIVFNFSWDVCNTQEKWKTKVMQNFGGHLRCIMGSVEVAN